MAWALEVRTFATGTAAITIAASVLATFCIFLVTTRVKSRHVRIIGGLGQQTAAGDAQPPISDSPAGSRSGGFKGSKTGDRLREHRRRDLEHACMHSNLVIRCLAARPVEFKANFEHGGHSSSASPSSQRDRVDDNGDVVLPDSGDLGDFHLLR